MSKSDTGRKARSGESSLGIILMLLVVVLALAGVTSQLRRIADAAEGECHVQE